MNDNLIAQIDRAASNRSGLLADAAGDCSPRAGDGYQMNLFFLKRLRNLITIDPLLSGAIRNLPMTAEVVAPGGRIAEFGERFEGLHVILSGWAMQYVLTGRDRRRITGFLAPGDFYGNDAECHAKFDHCIFAVGECVVGRITATELVDLTSRFPEIATAMARSRHIEAATLRRWMTLTEDARQGLAHLLSEVMFRLNAVDIHTANGIHFPITQEHMAQALGLTPVHLNRMLGQLRTDNLLKTKGRLYRVIDEVGLHRAGRFDSRYLRPCASDEEAGAGYGHSAA